MEPQSHRAASIVPPPNELEEAMTACTSTTGGHDFSNSTSRETDIQSTSFQEYTPLIYASSSTADNLSFEHLTEGDTGMDGRKLLELANRAKRDLFSAFNLVISAVAKENPGSPFTQASILSLLPDPNFATWTRSVHSAFNLMENLLAYLWVEDRNSVNRHDLTRVLAIASRDRKRNIHPFLRSC